MRNSGLDEAPAGIKISRRNTNNLRYAQLVKNPPVMWETWVQSLAQKDPLEEGKATHSRVLAGESYGQRNLAGYSSWDHKELDATE